MRLLIPFLIILKCGLAFSAEIDLKDAVIAAKVVKHADVTTEYALSAIETEVANSGHTVQQHKQAYDRIHFSYQPDTKGSVAPVDVGVDLVVVSFSTSLQGLTELDEADRADMNERLKDLRALYESPSATDGQKLLISSFFADYLHTDINKTAEEELNSNDGDLVEMKALVNTIQQGNKDLHTALKSDIETITADAVTQTQATVVAQKELLEKKMEQETNDIKTAIANAANPILEQLGTANATLSYLEVRERERAIQEKISRTTNSEVLAQMIDQARDCQSKEPLSDCVLLKKEIDTMTARKSQLERRDAFYMTGSALQLAKDIALMAGDSKLAGDIGKAIYVAQTAEKITNLAIGLGAKAAFAAAGDVMSMASLGMSIIGAFGSGGESADAMILKELAKIRKAIEELRVEMHKRFDELSLQVAHLGLSLNLKLQQTNMNISVVADNQALLQDLIQKNSYAIAGLAQVRSNSDIALVARQIKAYAENIDADNNDANLYHTYMDSTALFVSYLDYINHLDLFWGAEKDYSLTSEHAIYVVSRLSGPTPQTNFSHFALLDYLLKGAQSQDLGGECYESNFNNVYLFNTLATTLLPIFRAQYGSAEMDREKSKYVQFLTNEDINGPSILSRFDRPLRLIDATIATTDVCMNKYADVNGKQVNFISYLLEKYAALVKQETQKLLSNVMSGRHMEALRAAIMDPTDVYFADMGKDDASVDLSKPENRDMIDLSLIDFRNSMADNTQGINAWFFQKYKTIPLCHTSSNGIDFFVEDYVTIEMPENLLQNLFTQASKLGLRLGLNEIVLCYSSTGRLLPMAAVTAPEQEPAVNAFDIRIRPFNAPPLTPSIKGIDLDVVLNIPIFIPTKNVEIFEGEELAEDHVMMDILEHGGDSSHVPPPSLIPVPSGTGTVTGPSLTRYLTTQFLNEEWECQPLEYSKALSSCWVKGQAPSAAHFAERAKGIPIANGKASRAFSKQLAIEKLPMHYDRIRRDLIACYRRTLLGFNNCTFGSQKSVDSLENRVNLTEPNQINTVLRTLIPILANFKEGVAPADQQQFVVDLDVRLGSLTQKVLAVSASEGDLYKNLEAEFTALNGELRELGSRADFLLEIRTGRLLNSEAYDSFKFYRKKTARILGLLEKP